MDISQNILPLYATPLVNSRLQNHESLNKKLLSYILDCEQRSAGVVKSNVGGWHSELDFFDTDNPAIGELHQQLTELVKGLVKETSRQQSADSITLQGWANVLRYGQYNCAHCHPNALWSGVYYVTGNATLAEHPFSGKMELMDPRPGASLTFDDSSTLYGRYLINPVPGQVLLFPGWLQHQVHPYFADDVRISIAFNMLNPSAD